MNSRVKRLVWAVCAMAALVLILGTPMTVLAQAGQEAAPQGATATRHGGEANLILPDLSAVRFLGVDGHSLLLVGVLISVLAHPTTGGVTASFASLGDVILAEPGALTSFAGPRVVAQTTREKLPDDFGLAESNFRFGHVDAVVQRNDLRTTLARLLRLFGAER